MDRRKCALQVFSYRRIRTHSIKLNNFALMLVFWLHSWSGSKVPQFDQAIHGLLVCYKPTTHPFISSIGQYMTTRNCKLDANFHEPFLIGANSLVFRSWLVSLRFLFFPHNHGYMQHNLYFLSHTTIALSVQPIPSVLGYLMVEALH